jgi:2'-hydroxyisoflavone reductase
MLREQSLTSSSPLDRRAFLKAGAAASALAALGLPALGRAVQDRATGSAPAGKKLSILVLGGTGFIGPHIVERALARGHTCTLFNRGRTNAELFPDCEKLYGDRDPNVGEGLKAIEAEVHSGRSWDGVVDTSGYVPRIVGASANLLAASAGQYVFVSSVSVYADQEKQSITEDDPVGVMADPTVEEMGEQFENYGPLKALCEEAATKAMNGNATNVRPGFIVGPRDPFPPRFNLWVSRVKAGGERICPGDPNDPVQLIDARDLAAFIIHAIENKTMGTFNLVGPAERLSIERMIDGIVEGTGATIDRLWIPTDFLDAQQATFGFVPWVPPTSGLATVSNERAKAAGYTSTPVATTARDTLAWLESDQVSERLKTALNELMTNGQEEQLIEAWKNRNS